MDTKNKARDLSTFKIFALKDQHLPSLKRQRNNLDKLAHESNLNLKSSVPF